REVVAAHPAVLLGERQAEQSHLAHLVDDLVRERVPLVEVTDNRRDDVVCELAYGLPQRFVLLAEHQVRHGGLSLASWYEGSPMPRKALAGGPSFQTGVTPWRRREKVRSLPPAAAKRLISSARSSCGRTMASTTSSLASRTMSMSRS